MTHTDRPAQRKVLVADASARQRAILSGILGEGHEILEAEDATRCLALLHGHGAGLALVLLAADLPGDEGNIVLDDMQARGLLADVPVLVLVDPGQGERLATAYALGATDCLVRPCDPVIARRRIANLLAHARGRERRARRNERLLVDFLSRIVEFRNGESGRHVLHVSLITAMLLRALASLQGEGGERITPEEADLITTASALHDIGKLAIDERILNKRGRLTAEEFETVKAHTVYGADMVARLPLGHNEPLARYARAICRSHHERYDGSGYPDGLRGNEIPLCAQVVGMADVYDALTSRRAYKEAYDHRTAMRMILAGECGTFNPLLIECLKRADSTGTLPVEAG